MAFSFGKANDQRTKELEAVYGALDKVQAIIYFDPNGTILDSNANFLAIMGYELDEIVGRQHAMFVDSSYAASGDYKAHWDRLAKGEFVTGEFKRLAKGGRVVHIEASYNPIFDDEGNVEKIVKFAIDKTELTQKTADWEDQLNALSRSQAVIEFKMDGTIVKANENFLSTMGYSLGEIVGKEHKIFVSSGEAGTSDYQNFWKGLATGQPKVGTFKRVRKDGAPVWISGAYYPILGPNGTPQKVIKFARDVTRETIEASENKGKIDAISKVQAVLEMELDGKIIDANRHFLDLTGYHLDEIKGQNHSILVGAEKAATEEYRTRWTNLRNGTAASFEDKIIDKGGEEIWLRGNNNPILDPDGKPTKIISVSSDYTSWRSELDAIVGSLQALSNGDLTMKLPSEGAEDFSRMRSAFNETLKRLNELVSDINFAASSIQEESESIAESANNLSSRCERQAATVEQTSASMEEMSSTVQSNAQNAKEATAAAKNASENAEQGGQIVKDAIDAMGKIEEGSTEIRKIIEVIDSIAFQTNLLALNAGVEAARAGDAGSGFAVVASEVRALAQRASESARDISALIETSEKQVADGAALVKSTGEALTEIVGAVSRVSSGIDEIFTASSEQATGVTEINQAMSDIDSTTQRTAAISEESTAAAANLAQRATSLRDLVSFFTVDGATRPIVAETPAVELVVPDPVEKRPPASKPKPEVAPVATGQLAIAQDEDDDDWREF